MDMIVVQSKELIAIGYNQEEHAIYVQDKLEVTHVYENQSKEQFDHFLNSKQTDYFYDVCLKETNANVNE